MIFYNFVFGRQAFKQNDPQKIRLYAILVFVCFVIQIVQFIVSMAFGVANEEGKDEKPIDDEKKDVGSTWSFLFGLVRAILTLALLALQLLLSILAWIWAQRLQQQQDALKTEENKS